ncbi:MAG: tRNA lysidine(34) synthetase TilS, partial [Candidatus Moraniibacteriota bacterium]
MTTLSKMKKGSLNKPLSRSFKSSQNVLSNHSSVLTPFVRRFIKRVLNTVKKFDLWHKGDSFVVCVSGGPDSLCLLDILSLLSEKYHFTLHIVHVNYHLRGNDSTLDEKLVLTRAKNYSLPSTVLSYKKNLKEASEEKLRTIRYAFFEKIRTKNKADHIVVAHNEDDQAETLLMRLIRGSGLRGLSAMRPKNDCLIRPLIEMSRADIIQYLKDRDITYREDKSNTDTKYLRNKVRHELIPFLEEKFQPQTKKLLAETATLLGEDYALLSNIPSHLPIQHESFAVEFSCKAIISLPQALMAQEIRQLLRPFLDGKNPDKSIILELTKALKSTKSKTQTLTFKGLKFIRKGDRVR